MRLAIIQRIIGIFLIAFSVTLLPPMLVSLYYQDGAMRAFLFSFGIMTGLGAVLWFPVRSAHKELHIRDAFLITFLFWTVISFISALPFLFSPGLNLAQAVFEAVSGFTTTGATVITELENLPKSILYYRQQLAFLGGIGIIVLAVAVLPMLGIGGMQLLKAETPGPMRDDKLTPRIGHAIRATIVIYVALNAACAVGYWAAGMTWFDAIGHAYTTVATSGFSTHDASFGFFNSPLIEFIAIIFMLLGSLNFTIHFIAWRKLDISQYWKDIQGRVFLYIVIVLSGICTAVLMWEGTHPDFLTALRHGTFHLVSVMTTTGFVVEDYSLWPSFLPVLVLGSSFIGGCVGSTTGGMRVIRFILLYKQAVREITRLIHPNAVLTVKIGQKKVSDEISQAVWGFVFLYMTSYIFLSLALMATGVNIVTAFSGIAACLNLTGPGLDQVSMSFKSISDTGLWISTFAMLLGRLEVFTIFVLLTPSFWRR